MRNKSFSQIIEIQKILIENWDTSHSQRKSRCTCKSLPWKIKMLIIKTLIIAIENHFKLACRLDELLSHLFMEAWWPSGLKYIFMDHSISRFGSHLGRSKHEKNLSAPLPKIVGFPRAIWSPLLSKIWLSRYTS